jgi:hypothetical protein
VINLVDDLPHFLLLLLILQRFDDAKWGYFTECPQSGMKVVPQKKLYPVSFDADDSRTGQRITITFYPEDDEIYLGTTLIGRGTSVIGGRRGPPPESAVFGDTKILRGGNDLVVKVYWPEEKRMSEVEILKKAKEYGQRIDFISEHTPEMVCHQDPNFLCSSTKAIRQFLGLPADGSRRVRVIAFRRLLPIKDLKEKDMLTAYLQCFFCKHNKKTILSMPLMDLRHRPLLFVEEGDPAWGYQPWEHDVGRQAKGGSPQRFRPREALGSGGRERARQHWNVAIHGPGPAVGRGSTWGDPSSVQTRG